MSSRKARSRRSPRHPDEHQEVVSRDTAAIPAAETESAEVPTAHASATAPARAERCDDNDVRESLVNDCRQGTKYEIATKVDHVSAIHAFMADLDCSILNPAVVGEECVRSPVALYEQHVQHWLDRDPVLAKAEVRDTGGGVHVLLRLDTPIICTGNDARGWDKIARGLRNTLPGDPKLNGIIAMTRPVGAANTKYAPAKTVSLLRSGTPVERDEILDLCQRAATAPASLWMRTFHGGERVSPCPLCGQAETTLGVAGNWQVQCYKCDRVSAAALVYRFYSPEFLKERKDSNG